MRTAVKVCLSLAMVLGFMVLVQADDKKEEKKEVTLKGTMVCGKCTLGECKKCTNVLKVKEGGKTVAVANLVPPDLAEVAESLDALLRDSDYVSLHCPLDATTRGLISRQAIAGMREGAFLVNTGRGALVDGLLEKEYRATIREFDRVIGLKWLKAFHLNDSKKPQASRVDRHEHIGKGCLGIEPFRFLVNDCRFRNKPMVLETPKENDPQLGDMDAHNLAVLRSLLQSA